MRHSLPSSGLRPVTIIEFSRLNFVNTILSKRQVGMPEDTQALRDTGTKTHTHTPRGTNRH